MSDSRNKKERTRKKYANRVNNDKTVLSVISTLKSVNEKDFTGDIYLNYFKKISIPEIVGNGVCIKDNNYKWLEFYDYSSKVKLTAMYDQNNSVIEWYFDIAKKIGKENEIPYEDDLYLDVVAMSTGEIMLLDEEELKDALTEMKITKTEFEIAYKEAKNLICKINGKADKLQKFTDKYLELMIKD